VLERLTTLRRAIYPECLSRIVNGVATLEQASPVAHYCKIQKHVDTPELIYDVIDEPTDFRLLAQIGPHLVHRIRVDAQWSLRVEWVEQMLVLRWHRRTSRIPHCDNVIPFGILAAECGPQGSGGPGHHADRPGAVVDHHELFRLGRSP
jgi:hypothetical protein